MNRVATGFVTPLVVAAAIGACGDGGQSAKASPTYWDDMVPIFEGHCVQCHQENGIGPFRLDQYAPAKQQAASIRATTEARSMPPWPMTSDGSCGTFADSLALSEDEVALIGAWVAGGAQEGKPSTVTLPSAQTLKGALVFETPELVPVAQGGELAESDEYRCFMLDSGIAAQAFINGYDVVPGAPQIVHHVLGMLVDPSAAADTSSTLTNLEQMTKLDAESPDREGWPCFGMAGDGVNVEATPVVWAPGQGVVEYPSRSGIPIKPEHKVVIQVHYNLADVTGLADQTQVKLRTVSKVDRVGFFGLPDPFLDSLGRAKPDTLAAGKPSVKYTWKLTMAQLGLTGVPSVELAGVMPHMHQLGRQYRMTLSNGASESVCAADVKNWDFHWQRLYFYEKPIALTDDTVIEVTCDYDTSSRKEPVLPGWGTENEMCLASLYVTVPLAVFGP